MGIIIRKQKNVNLRTFVWGGRISDTLSEIILSGGFLRRLLAGPFRKVVLGRFQAAVKLFYEISWLYYNDHMVYQDRMEGRQ